MRAFAGTAEPPARFSYIIALQTMAVGQRQRVSGLKFLLYSRALHPELFDLYHSQRIVKKHYEAQVWITGMGHVIGFYHGRDSLAEVIEDDITHLPPRGQMFSLPIRGQKDHRVDHVNGIRHLISMQVEKMSARLYNRSCEELSEQADRTGIMVSFPLWAAQRGLQPFTYLDLEAKGRQLHVFSYHAFPDERTLVKTQSIFELTE